MINQGKIKPGDKFHFFGLFLMKRDLPGFDKQEEINSEHYFLQNQHYFHLKINLNGMNRAHFSLRLGEQDNPFFRKFTGSIS